MFGRSRLYSGVIISPTELGRGLALADLISAIWPQVLQANEFAPSHSRIMHEVSARQKAEI